MTSFFSVLRGQLRSRPGRLVLFWLVLLLSGSQAYASGPGTEAGPSLAAALNPDGTLRPGVSGSFDARHFVMRTAPDGRPAFSPASTRGTGDERWQDGFGLPGTNGIILTVVQAGTSVYVGGNFTAVGGTTANNIAKWDGTSWSSLGAGVNDQVTSLAVAGTSVYVGGTFTTAGSVTANRVARWDGSAWSSLGTGTANGLNSAVIALAVAGANLYVGGTFTTAGNVTANRVARWNGTSWSSLGIGAANGVNSTAIALAVAGTSVYVGGTFTTAGGITANNIARWSGTSWSSLGIGAANGANGIVTTVAVAGTSVYVGGDFTMAGNVTANRVAKWDGTNWNSLGTGAANGVNSTAIAVAVAGTSVYVGGDFTTAGGVASSHIARWDGTSWHSLGAGVNSTIITLSVLGTSVYAGGNFTTAGGATASHIAKWNGTSWNSPSVANGVGGTIYTVAVAGTSVYVGGDFTTAGNVAANRVAKWDGTNWSSLGTGTANGVDGIVTTIAVAGTSVYVGGTFTTAGNMAASYIARWDGTSWHSLGAGVDATVNAVAIAGTSVYVGGDFTTAGNVTANRVAQWNGTSWSSLGVGVDATVNAIAVAGTSVYVGGDFTTAGSTPANYIAQWDGTSWSSLSSGVNSTVYALAVAGPSVYVGGDFTTAGNVTANYIAQWDGTSWSSLGTGAANGVAGTVIAVAVAGPSVYVGGSFTTAGGTTTNNIAKWDGTSWSSLGTGTNATVDAVAAVGASIYAGGSFATVGDGSKVMANFGIYTDYLLPMLTSLTPTSGVTGSTISLTGINLTGATTITFTGPSGNLVTTGFTVNSAGTQITGVVVPAGATTGLVTVTTPGGTSNGLTFTVLLDLVVSTGTLASPTAIAGGNYRNITVTATGVGQLAGSVQVQGTFLVDGGSLLTNCQPLTGSGNFTFTGSGTLGICEPAGLSASGPTGAVQVTGTRTFGSAATYLYNGITTQITGNGLPGEVANLTTANSHDLTLTKPVRVNQVLTLGSNGNLLLNGQALLLPSTSTGAGVLTALVVNSGPGIVVGNTVTMQRAIDASGNLGSSGYRHYSSPVSGATVASLATTASGGSFTPVVNPAYNTSAAPGTVTPYPTVYGYDQRRLTTSPATGLTDFDKGYYSPTVLTDALEVGQGYTVQISNAEKVAFTGTLTTGSLGFSALNRDLGTDAGWHLVGNPYPAPLDWGSVAASQLVGLDAAVYVFQSTGAYTGRYTSFVNGVGASQGVLAAGQGFFVRTSSAGTPGSFSLTNANRVTTYGTQAALQRTTAGTRPLLRLSLGLGSQPATTSTAQDETFVYFETGATAGFDGKFDAYKLANSNGYYLGTASADASPQGLSINGRAVLTAASANDVVPVWLSVPAGTYTLTATELVNFAAMAGGTQVLLRDALLGTLTNLTTTPSYHFSVAANAATSGRFSLLIGTPTVLASQSAAIMATALVTLHPNPATGPEVTLAATGLPAAARQLEATLLSPLGQVVGHLTLPAAQGAAQGGLPTTGLAAGVYVVRLTLRDAQGQALETLPAQRLSVR